MQEILAQLKSLQLNEKAVLATVVDVRGSSYRLPGAKMLIKETGESFGIVSGGCLEADVIERAKKVIQTNQAFVITYDTSAKDDDVFSLRLGCNGVVRILLEKVDTETSFTKFLEKISLQTKNAVVATLISSDISELISSKLMLDFNGNFQTDNENLDVSGDLIKDCEIALLKGRSFIKNYQNKNGDFEFLIEVIKPPVDLTIFGAGHDAIPLANFAKNLGWRVSIVDHRKSFANDERFVNVDKIEVIRNEHFDFSTFSESSVVVVMTHDYEKDKAILSKLLSLNLKYVGALGPKRRAVDILEELIKTGQTFSPQDLQKLYAPVGLDIGAETPEAIALSIIAEINGVLSNRDGGFLRNRKTSIYEQTQRIG